MTPTSDAVAAAEIDGVGEPDGAAAPWLIEDEPVSAAVDPVAGPEADPEAWPEADPAHPVSPTASNTVDSRTTANLIIVAPFATTPDALP